ncbi:hypothetical protein LJC20_06795 [Eubacteriales bacterium OttesenSCG-928-M02]|nr:hypothetical protein [Eubacteriales bacterium OttesenSCG-928-M02]
MVLNGKGTMRERTKKSDGILTALFCLFLGGMLVLFLCLPKEVFSENEKRYLAEMPTLNWDTVASGRFSEQAENYTADHLPFRSFFVAINAYLDLYTGRQTVKDIYVAEGDRLVERPAYDGENLEKNLGYINRFVEKIGQPVDVMLVPNAGYLLEDRIQGRHDPYLDGEYLGHLQEGLTEGAHWVDVTDVLAVDVEKMYYRTDHHWTSEGAYGAYRAYMLEKGRDALAKEAFAISTVSDFYGSTYSRSALWLTAGEHLEIWDGGIRASVYISDDNSQHDGMFFENRLAEADKYTVFLDGNHSLVRITNRDGKGKGKLLLIRDSFGNSLAPFLALGYEEVVLVDLRYYKLGIKELCALEGFDDILILYGLNHFVGDTNLAWLK